MVSAQLASRVMGLLWDRDAEGGDSQQSHIHACPQGEGTPLCPGGQGRLTSRLVLALRSTP